MNWKSKASDYKLMIFLVVLKSNLVCADVYIDFSQAEEITIGNVSQNKHSAEFIEEPRELEQQLLLKKSKGGNKIDNKNLPYHDEVLLAASESNLDPALIHAVITVESRHNSRAKSSKGAAGLMQLMPATAKQFNVKDSYNPKQNISAGAKYLGALLLQFNGDLALSLAAYNAGPSAIIKNHYKLPPYKETLYYVPQVLKYYKQYS